MREFSELLSRIEQTNSTNEKVDYMAAFFRTVDAETSAWALYFLSGRRPKKFIGSSKLRAWAEELAQIPAWLAEECYAAVGDSAEMIALILAPLAAPVATGPVGESTAPSASPTDIPLATWITERLEPLRDQEESFVKSEIQNWWKSLTVRETFVLNKLMTGALRIGVSETLVYRALAQAFGIPAPTVAARLLGNWRPSGDFFSRVTRAPEGHELDSATTENMTEALPVPFCLAAPLDGEPAALGAIAEWQIEWKWDGIRAQVVKVGDKVELWSRGEERVTEAFPDLAGFFAAQPGDFTLDGEIVAGTADQLGTFNDLQKRLNRKKPSAALTRDQPVAYLAYDYLREGDARLTDLPLSERRARLELAFGPALGTRLGLSPILALTDWAQAAVQQLQARERGAEGLMLKRKDAVYATGRKRGIWFKWKVDPLTLDVVLTAAQPGTGRRASLYTDYTFAIWKGPQLVPIAKAYSGLSDAEIVALDQWIRKNTLERHGPVRTLKPERVFEIGFEGVAESTRHKSGFAVRFPRILRERTDKKAEDADHAETVAQMLMSLSRAGALHDRRGKASEVTGESESQAKPGTQLGFLTEIP